MLFTDVYPLKDLTKALEAMLYITVRGDSWGPDGQFTKSENEMHETAKKNVKMLLEQVGLINKDDAGEDTEEDDLEDESEASEATDDDSDDADKEDE